MKKIADTREKRAKLNIFVSLGCQALTLLCGLVIPRLMIGHFGSEAYGATASIAQFLAYITLLEGGIGGVARAALYMPLAKKNIQIISEIVAEIKRFFRIIGCVFLVYVVILACVFKGMAHIECFDWLSTFVLVTVISISTFAQYFIGISYTVLIQASQRTYITNIVNISTTVLNTILIVILIRLGSSLILVKLVSSCIFVFRPVIMARYMKRHFQLVNCKKTSNSYLSQKWSGLGQHIAFFLHSNTDIAVLTILANLKVVAVYSVYNMVVSQIQNFTTSFATGMEALFGEMLAKNEKDELQKTFGRYEMLISMITTVLFSITAVMLVPFVSIYTRSVNDANYREPIFAILLVLASVVYCLRMPYHSITIAAGHFKQTQAAAYGEATINIVLSVILVIKFGLVGVAIGTLAAATFRLVYYVLYLRKNIIYRRIRHFIKRELVNIGVIGLIFLIGSIVVNEWNFTGYVTWVVCSVIVTLIAILIVLSGNYMFYRNDLQKILKKK